MKIKPTLVILLMLLSMATLIVRSDGSSNFAKGHRWGTFPSVSAGWVISEEKFMQKSRSWEDKNFFGFGGYAASMSPEWFAYDANTIGMYAGYFGMTGEPTGSWTLDVEGNFSVSPTNRTGTFTYDFDDKVPNWSVGKLKVDHPIIFGTSISMTSYQPSYQPTEFYIVKCDADHLVLAALSEKDASPAAYAPCVFWCFKAQK